MKRMRLRRIGLRSVFLLLLVLYGVVGLLVGIGLYVLSTVGVTDTVGMTALDRLGLWSLLLFPVGYGLTGGLAGMVAAALYNAAAALTGGIRLELEESHPVEVEAPGREGRQDLAGSGGEERPSAGGGSP